MYRDPKRSRTIRAAAPLLFAAGAMAACSDNPVAARPPEAAERIEIVSGDAQATVNGCALAQPLVVRVTDGSGVPVRDAPVHFVREGDEGATPVVVTSGPDGEAEVPWTLRPGDPHYGASEQVVAALEAAPSATARFTVHGVAVSPGGYGTSGNRILDASCEPHRFVGVARPGLEWWPEQARLMDPGLAAADFATMKSWGANLVRIPLNQRYWLRDVNLEGRIYPRAEYQALVERTVQAALDTGLDVMLTLHTSDRGDPSHPDTIAAIQQMADVNHSIPFWRDLARRYADDGRVIFQLYNEPNQLEAAGGSEAAGWRIWRDGGRVPGGITIPDSYESRGAEFEAAGMQDLYDAVRSTGAHNLVIVNGMHWGYRLSGLPEHALDGYNIVYASHPYDYPDKQPEDWDEDWGFLAEHHPVIISEFGDHTCNRDGYITSVLDYADRHELSWVAWAWIAADPERPDMVCSFPTLITDWGGTPSPQGAVIRARMQSYLP